MLTIYGVYRSRASRPLWLLAETGTPFRHVPVIQAYRLADPAAADAPVNTASPSFTAINPQGLIPCMEEDGLVLTESMAMTLWIAKRHGGDLGPRDLAEDGLMTMWAFIAATGIEAPAFDILMAHGRKEADTPEGRALVAARLRTLGRPLGRMEAVLQSSPWLVGGRFTVADIVVAECLRYALAEPGALDAWPAVGDWIARCHARPGFKAMWAARDAEPV